MKSRALVSNLRFDVFATYDVVTVLVKYRHTANTRVYQFDRGVIILLDVDLLELDAKGFEVAFDTEAGRAVVLYEEFQGAFPMFVNR
jgi:hypothetical protein